MINYASLVKYLEKNGFHKSNVYENGDRVEDYEHPKKRGIICSLVIDSMGFVKEIIKTESVFNKDRHKWETDKVTTTNVGEVKTMFRL